MDSYTAYLVSFVLFVVLIWRPVGRTVVKGLDDYSARIRHQIDEAVRLREDAQALLASYHRRQHEAEKEAALFVAQAEQESALLREQAVAELEADMARRKRTAEDRIAIAASRMVEDVRRETVHLVMDAVAMVLAQQASAPGAQHLQQMLGQLPDFSEIRTEAIAA